MVGLTTSTQRLLHDLLRHSFGAQVVLLRSTVASQRPGYVVVLAELRYPTTHLSIKLADPHVARVAPFKRVAALHRLVASQTSIAMAEIVACDVSCQRWPWQYLIKSYLPGQEWAVVRPKLQPDERRSVEREIAQAVAALHAIRFPAFGQLGKEANVEGGQPLLPGLAEHARRIISTPHLADLFCCVLDQNAALFANVERASLCHDDLHGHNILVRQQQGRWQLATILDFDKAWAGHHQSDLARLDLWSGMTSPEFWAVYRASQPIDSLYQQRRPIYQLLWCLEYAATTPRHLADTRHVCKQLGIPPITHFD